MNDDHLRIGDAERERAAAELGEHYAQGRLDAAEHAERLDRVMAARTRGELPAIFRDLPGANYGRGPLLPRPPYAVRPDATTGSPWRGPRGPRGLPVPLRVLLVVVAVLVVATHPALLLVGLLLWVLLHRGRHHHRHGSWGHPRRGG